MTAAQKWSWIVAALDLRDDVVLTGWLGIDQVVAAMSAADVLVVPKIDDLINHAGFPTKIAEYLAMGKAVATSTVGDISRYLTNGEDAVLCEPGNSHDLAQALYRLLSDSNLREHLGRAARQTALRYFDYRASGQQIEVGMLATHAG